MQAGLTTVEVEGVLPQLAGTGVRVVVATRDTTQLVFDRKVGIMSSGKITVTLPVYSWQDGDYILLIARPNDMKTPLAGGVFKKRTGSGGAAGVRSEPEVQRQSGPASSPTWVGEWRGINRTAGLVKIAADGTYDFNGGAGRWKAAGHQIVFTGPLAAWDNGKATLKDGVIEFYWTNAQGWKQWFTFAKVK